jgi:hypothetical protein
LAWASPCDPKTLNRAARDHLTSQPTFAMQCALAALHWMSTGHGYELTGLDVQEAHSLAIDAASQTQQTEKAQSAIAQMLATGTPTTTWMKQALGMAPLSALPKSR